MPTPTITLTTDFGTTDSFVGAMKGVILSIISDVQVVDLTHEIPPQDVHAAAFTLASAYRYFPPGTIHVAVIDPDVGTRRLPLAVATGNAIFICPDNGLLSYLLAEVGVDVKCEPFIKGQVALPSGWRAIHLSNPDYWLNPLSSTFHGRDIFAPVAAHLATGVALASMGSPVLDIAAFAIPRPRIAPGISKGQVLHVDRFGNLITNLRVSDLPTGKLEVRIGAVTISGLAETYQDGASLVALIGSGGTVEIAFRNGSASRKLGITVGSEVHVTSRD